MSIAAKNFPRCKGVYVYADYVLGTFWGFRYRNGKVMENGTLLEQPKNMTSLAQDADGELYAVTYDGHVFSIILPETPNTPRSDALLVHPEADAGEAFSQALFFCGRIQRPGFYPRKHQPVNFLIKTLHLLRQVCER